MFARADLKSMEYVDVVKLRTDQDHFIRTI